MLDDILEAATSDDVLEATASDDMLALAAMLDKILERDASLDEALDTVIWLEGILEAASVDSVLEVAAALVYPLVWVALLTKVLDGAA